VLVFLAALVFWKRPDHAIRVATASIAEVMCSGVFVEGMTPERAFTESYADDKGLKPLRRGLHYAVDRAKRRITTDWHGHFVNQSTYYPSYGCALPWQTPAESTLQAARGVSSPAEA
jgi:hypothetical protein